MDLDDDEFQGDSPTTTTFNPDEAEASLNADLLNAFQSRFSLSSAPISDPDYISTETHVLSSAQHVSNNSIDVFVDRAGTQNAAAVLSERIRQKPLTTKSWRSHELHPTVEEFGEEECVNFMFAMDCLNFSFWSGGSEDEEEEDHEPEDTTKQVNGEINGDSGMDNCSGKTLTDGEAKMNDVKVVKAPNGPTVAEASSTHSKPSKPFTVDYNGKPYTGYWSLIAVLRRALDDQIPITSPDYWISPSFSVSHFRYIFRPTNPSTHLPMPMLKQRHRILQETGHILATHHNGTPLALLEKSHNSARRLSNLLARDFPSFRDETHHPSETNHKLHFLKRAQIFAADVWACFDGKGLGAFNDVEEITAFADYRVPQMLREVGVVRYAPALERVLREGKRLDGPEIGERGRAWEAEIRAAAVWGVEMLKREILRGVHLSNEAVMANGNESSNTAENDDKEKMADDPFANLNSILLDFYLYDTVKELEVENTAASAAAADNSSEESKEQQQQPTQTFIREEEMLPHHRVRSIYY